MNEGLQSYFQADLDEDTIVKAGGDLNPESVAIVIGTSQHEEHITLNVHDEDVFDQIEKAAQEGRRLYQANAYRRDGSDGDSDNGDGGGDGDGDDPCSRSTGVADA